MTNKIALYPGTFDPFTNGHLDITERASKLFDKVIVTIATNTKKVPLFSITERIELIKDATRHLPNVSTDRFEGLLVDFAAKCKAISIIRGLRAISDFEFEFQMALMNRSLNNEVTTVFLMPNEKYTYLNSSIVREVAEFGGNIEKLVSPLVAARIKEKFKQP
ncbi:MAG: pantetheine-phosphate adenylyltransferase [Calditrichales bacterium]|nr:MAG: pantetheine-phosphate adenylyltransferase [Calditrichales bacterium]